MNASYLWLKDLVDFDSSADKIAEVLTKLGLSVEKITRVGKDACYELELTANRPDWLGHIGIARELCATFDLPLKLPETTLGTKSGSAVEKFASVRVLDTKSCPEYTGAVIRGVKVEESPDWLKQRLEGIGLTPRSNVVDITNYVLMLTGQPLHAFDLDTLAEKHVVVRLAKKGEEICLLENAASCEKTKLNETDLVIADATHPVALAGIMGGVRTAITDKTVNLFIESARFDKNSIQVSRKKHHIESDSGYRFERYIDTAMVDFARNLAVKLITELAGGKPCDGVISVTSENIKEFPDVTMNFDRARSLLALEFSPKKAEQIFSGLGTTVKECSKKSITVSVPSFRPDLEREVDMIEEIARHIGLDKIPAKAAMTVFSQRPRKEEVITDALKDSLVQFGFSETLGDIFCAPKKIALIDFWSREKPLTVKNPMNKELNGLRMSCLQSLLLATAFNQKHFIDDIDLFELGRIFLPLGKKLPQEKILISLISTTLDYSGLKGVAENIFDVLRVDEILYRSASLDFLETGRCSEIISGDKAIGFLGEISASLAKEYDVGGTLQLMELDLGALIGMRRSRHSFKTFSRYPAVKRDIAIVIDESVSWGSVEKTIRELKLKNLQELRFFDQYQSEQIGKGKKSYAFNLRYGSKSRTLTAQEVEQDQDKIMDALKMKHSAALRE